MPKPRYPLKKHKTGQYYVRFRKRNYYYGSDINEASVRYGRDLPLMLDGIDPRDPGRTPQEPTEGATMMDLSIRFLRAKREQMEAGDITPHTYDDYVRTAALVSEGIGQHTPAGDIGPDHFERLLQDWNRFSPVHRGNMVCRAKTMFGYCWDCGMLEKPVRFGPHFKRPPRRSIRQAERRVGKRIFTAEEIHRLLSAADPAMIAMILLGINCGYENHDIAKMVISDYHPENGWLDVPRPKTEIPRRCRLWPETIEAINHYLPQRKQPVKKEWNNRLFITSKGYSFWRETYSPLAGAFTKLTRQTGIHRPRMGFLWLRHTFATVAGDMADTVAIKHIMGHADHSMLAGYTHGIDDARLIAVSEHVRRWLFG